MPPAAALSSDFFWDVVHPTTRVHGLMAAAIWEAVESL